MLPPWKTALVQLLLGLLLVAAVGYSHGCSDDEVLTTALKRAIRSQVQTQLRRQYGLAGQELATTLAQLPEIALVSVKRRGGYLQVTISPEGVKQLDIPLVQYFHVRYRGTGYQLRDRSNAVSYYRSLF